MSQHVLECIVKMVMWTSINLN